LLLPTIQRNAAPIWLALMTTGAGVGGVQCEALRVLCGGVRRQ
jgi:hypothetical protein